MRSRGPGAALAGATLVAASFVAGCGPRVGVTRPMPRGVIVIGSTQPYPVDGRTALEIGAALASARRGDGRGFVGYHQWRMQWRWRYANTGSGCRISDVRIEVHSTVRIPEWRRPAGPPAELVDQWERYLAALQDHELQHERIVVEGAGEIVRRLEQLREMSCQTLGVEANREGERLVQELRERSARFDADTRHGGTAGARWPPPARPDPTP